ncbi:MAG TPA: PEP-CTERM sorting domain-containing protein, partial [Telluria sp.]|nr:PEP-CTERM sorting domain-containing protein [Telluria sp.]
MNAAKSLVATLILAAASLAPTAYATVIDFNHLAGTNVPGYSFNYGQYTWFGPGAGFTDNGFSFVGTSDDYLIGTAYSGANDGSYLAYNGTDYFMAYNTFTISSATAAPFKVNSLDLARWNDYGNVTQATLTGYKVGGGTVTQVVNLNTGSNAGKQTGNDFNTFVLSGFDNLSALTISHDGYDYLAMDNLVVNATTVPEPSSLALFGLAVAGCAFMRRRA